MAIGFLPPLIAGLCAYAAGCLSPGYHLVRWRLGRDIRESHSGSTGARNAGRVLGRGGFAAVFAFDALKGAGAIWIARRVGLDQAWIPALAPCIVTGHIWPAQLGFRGGKGLVTALGAMIGLDWRFLPAGLLLHFAPLALGRMFRGTARSRVPRMLSGAIPMAVMPFLPFPRWDPAQAACLAVASALVLWAHRSHALATETPVPTVTPE